MITKEVKEYSNRQRINLNKNDGFTPGDTVVIMTAKEYDKFKEDILDLTNQLRKTENKLNNIQEQQDNLEEMIDKVTNPIHQTYQKQLNDKDNEIKQIVNDLNSLKKICTQFNIDVMGLSAIDILFRSKHKKLVNEFNNSIWIIDQDKQVENIDLKKLPGNDDNE